MNEAEIGNIIKEARERQGITQEELCGLAITPVTLSRIENGRVLPSRKTREYLCQKLGILEYLVPYEPSRNDEEKFFLEKEIKKKIKTSEYNFTDSLERYAEIMSEDSPLEKQFYMYAKAVEFNVKTNNHPESQKMYLDALSVTFPNFTFDINLESHHFSLLEIVLINCIALELYNEDKESAMSVMRCLKKYCDTHLETRSEITSIYPAILFNIQNWEGFAGNWEEAYKVASDGIKFCMENGDSFILPDFFIDIGWNAFQLGRTEEAQKCIIEGCVLFKIRGDYDKIDKVLANLSFHSKQKLVITKDDF